MVIVNCVAVFFDDAATTAIYAYCHTRSLHDALPSLAGRPRLRPRLWCAAAEAGDPAGAAEPLGQPGPGGQDRRRRHGERHRRRRRPRQDRKSTRLNPVTNAHLVCRLMLEKKQTITHHTQIPKNSSLTQDTTS